MTRWALLGVLAIGCSSLPQPAPVADDACEAAGAHLAALGCRQARTPGGTPFAAVCRRAAADGRDLRADCLVGVQRCEDVHRVASTPHGERCP